MTIEMLSMVPTLIKKYISNYTYPAFIVSFDKSDFFFKYEKGNAGRKPLSDNLYSMLNCGYRGFS